MGLVLFALVLFAGPLGRAFTAGGVGRVLLRSVLIGAALVGVGVAAFLQGLLPHVVQSYFADRFLEAWRALASFSITGSGVGVRTGELGSAATRLLLAAGALRLFLANPWVGIGAGRSKDLLVAATGVLNVAHNSYLEMAMTGGLAGIAFLVAYFLPATRRSHGAPGQGGDLRALRACSVALYAVFGLVFLFLSLQANSILYIPVVVALALDRRSGEPELTVGSA